MAETILIPQSKDKATIYNSLLPQIKALIHGENNQVANLANTAAVLKEAFDFFWVGFYLIETDQLVLGPFQGPVACTRINLGKGVCGTAWKNKQTIIVDNVEEFPGHIACNAASKSEIVVPGIIEGEVQFVLDVDSNQLSDFDEIDQLHLEKLMKMLVENSS